MCVQIPIEFNSEVIHSFTVKHINLKTDLDAVIFALSWSHSKSRLGYVRWKFGLGSLELIN